MRSILLIALILAFSVGEADARHRGHFRHGYWGRAPRMIVAPPSYAPSRSPHVYTRELGREFPPPTWELQPPDPSWQGRRYMSPEGDAWLAFYASPADGEPISAHFKAVAFADGEEITALQASQDQLMVSGVKGDQAFYRKARLACEGRQWHHVALQFPFSTDRQQVHSYQMLIAQSARALDLADNDGCAASVAGNPAHNN